MPDDTLFQSMADWRKRRSRDRMRALFGGIIAGTSALQGVPVPRAIAGASAVVKSGTEEQTQAKLMALQMLTSLEKAKATVDAAKYQGEAAKVAAQYKAMGDMLKELAALQKEVIKGQAGIAQENIKVSGKILEQANEAWLKNRLPYDPEKAETAGHEVGGYILGLIESTGEPDTAEGRRRAAQIVLRGDSQQRLWQEVERATRELEPEEARAALEYADEKMGWKLFEQALGPTGEVRVGPGEGDVVRATPGDPYGEHPEYPAQPFLTVKSKHELGGDRISEAQQGAVEIMGQVQLWAGKTESYGIPGFSRAAGEFKTQMERLGFAVPDMSTAARTGEEAAVTGQPQPAGGVGELDETAKPTGLEARLYDFLEELDTIQDPNSMQAKAMIMQSEQFLGFMEKRGLQDPNMAWKQLKRESKVRKRDVQAADRVRSQELGARPGAAPAAPPPEPTGAARTVGGAATRAPGALAVPVEPEGEIDEKKKEKTKTDKLNQELLQLFRKKAEARVRR